MRTATLILISAAILLPAGTGKSQNAVEPDPFGSSTAPPAEPAGPMDEKTAKEDFKDFARVFWHAGDLLMKAMKHGGNVEDPVTFAAENKVNFLRFVKDVDRSVLRFSLKDDDDPEDYWEFEFAHERGAWKATRGWRIIDGNRDDLYSVSIFAPIPFRPLVQTELDKYFRKEGHYAADLKKKPSIETPEYACLIGEGGAGSGFHFTWKGKRFVASSSHQFDGEPEEFFSLDFDDPVKVEAVHEDDLSDLLVFKYESAALDKTEPLKFANRISVKPGDPMFVSNDEEWVLGHVIAADQYEFRIEMTKPVAAAGMSGSPIIHGLGGSVAGILIDADDPLEAKIVGADRITLPDYIVQEPDSDSIPPQIFGVKLKNKIPLDLAKHVQKELIYPEVFKVSPGMAAEQFRALRPGLPRNLTEEFTRGYRIQNAHYDLKQGKVDVVGFFNTEYLPPEHVLKLLDFVVAYFGEPARTIIRDYSKKKPGPELIGFYWSTDAWSARWEITDRGFSCDFLMYRGHRSIGDIMNLEDAREVRGPPGIARPFLQKWTKDIEARNRRE